MLQLVIALQLNKHDLCEAITVTCRSSSAAILQLTRNTQGNLPLAANPAATEPEQLSTMLTERTSLLPRRRRLRATGLCRGVLHSELASSLSSPMSEVRVDSRDWPEAVLAKLQEPEGGLGVVLTPYASGSPENCMHSRP